MHRSSVRKNVPQKQRVRRQDFEVFGSVEEKSVKGGGGERKRANRSSKLAKIAVSIYLDVVSAKRSLLLRRVQKCSRDNVEDAETKDRGQCKVKNRTNAHMLIFPRGKVLNSS